MSIHPRGFDFLKDVDVRLSVELGRVDMKLKDVLSLGQESVVVLDRLTDELLDVLVNGKPIAKGEIVAQNGRFGLRIVELAGTQAAEPSTEVAAVDFSNLGGGTLA
jgi:flagellar motor switch protein FliN/FliY